MTYAKSDVRDIGQQVGSTAGRPRKFLVDGTSGMFRLPFVFIAMYGMVNIPH